MRTGPSAEKPPAVRGRGEGDEAASETQEKPAGRQEERVSWRQGVGSNAHRGRGRQTSKGLSHREVTVAHQAALGPGRGREGGPAGAEEEEPSLENHLLRRRRESARLLVLGAWGRKLKIVINTR